MEKRTENPLTIEELKQKTAKLEQENAQLTAKLKWYEDQIRKAQKERFGASSEHAIVRNRRFTRLFEQRQCLLLSCQAAW